MNTREDSETDSDSAKGFKRRSRHKQPRFVKNSLDDINLQSIVLNSSRSQYLIFKQVTKDIGWIEQKGFRSENWDILWTDAQIGPDQLFKMHQYQKISHFPGINILARKNQLGKGLMKMRKQHQNQYCFFPLTWSLPSDFNQLSMFYNGCQNQKAIFIVKPEASCQGKGIFLTKTIQQLQSSNYVVQQYLQNPLLINKLKFDFRIYVLLLGCDPLRIYVYNEGLARFATQPYKHPKQKNLKSACIHLTNYSLNKKNPNFIFNKSEQKMDVGHKRSLSSIMTYLEKNGSNTKSLNDKINDLVIKTLISAQPLLSHIYRLSQPNNHHNDMCFQILGFDIILNNKLQPYLLQVNHNPSLVTDTPLDKFIKKKLVKDTLNLLNVNLKNKEQKISKKQKQIENKQNGVKTIKLSLQQRIRLRKQCQKQRDIFQNQNMGGFVKIYPTQNEKLMKNYELFLSTSRDIFEDKSGIKYNIKQESIPVQKTKTHERILSKKYEQTQRKKYNSVKIHKKKQDCFNQETQNISLNISKRILLNSARSRMQKAKLPQIDKGKFLTPQTFFFKDWQLQIQQPFPNYMSQFINKPNEKRLPSRQKDVRKRK